MSIVDSRNASKQEQYYFFNTLTALVKSLEHKYTTIDLRNECCVTGKVLRVDGHMNVELHDVIFYNSRGEQLPLEIFFVKARMIRSVHIPKGKSSIELVEEQLSSMQRKRVKDPKAGTLKISRAKKYQQETIQSAFQDHQPSSSSAR